MTFSTVIALYSLCILVVAAFITLAIVHYLQFHRKVDNFNQIGTSLLANGHVEEAITMLRKAVALSSRSAVSHSNLSLALSHASVGLQEALVESNLAIKLEPLNEEFLRRRRDLLLLDMPQKKPNPIVSLYQQKSAPPIHDTRLTANRNQFEHF
jgi:hypothetical protein